MAVVKRHDPDDIREIPKLLGIVQMACLEGGEDFLGGIAGELELLSKERGQFFTPYSLSRMMAELQLADVGELIKAKGFVTLQEPACGAGAMVIAAADVITAHGFDPSTCLYVEAIDVSPTAFAMAYLQIALRGIPATVRRGNTLSLEMFESAHTPAFFPFYAQHRDAFRAWQDEKPPTEPSRPQPTTPAKGDVKLIQLSLFE